MLRILFLIILFFLFSANITLALDVVYPTKQELKINAQSTFFAGNVNPKSTLKINNESIKIWDKGTFVHYMPLFYGTNEIVLEETLNGKTQKTIYTIKRDKPTGISAPILPFEEKVADEILYTKTIKDRATIRKKATKSSKRIVDLPKGVVLYIAGKQGDYYKIDAKGDFVAFFLIVALSLIVFV